MAHDRDAVGDDGRDLRGHLDAALQFHRLAAGLLDDPPRRSER